MEATLERTRTAKKATTRRTAMPKATIESIKFEKEAEPKKEIKKSKKIKKEKEIETAEPKIFTGNAALDFEIAFLSRTQLEKLTDFARYLNWSAIIDKGDSEYDEDDDPGYWADLPLTKEEEEMVRQSEEDRKNGEFLTLEEFLKDL